jgi:hypothetical protein
LSDLTATTDLDKRWFLCEKCRGLFAIDAGDTGDCPKGGRHAKSGPAYALWKGTSTTPPFMEAGWDERVKCSGLIWVDVQNGFSVCPAGGPHQPKGINYEIIRIYCILRAHAQHGVSPLGVAIERTAVSRRVRIGAAGVIPLSHFAV